MLTPLILKAILAAVIVGFVTAYIKINAVERFWSPSLQKYVSWTIAPILVIIGVRFFLVAVAG